MASETRAHEIADEMRAEGYQDVQLVKLRAYLIPPPGQELGEPRYQVVGIDPQGRKIIRT